MRKRIVADLIESSRGHVCRFCGQPAIVTSTVVLCLNDPECLAQIVEDEAATAYDHASHGCPNVDGGDCVVCDGTEEPCFI